MPIKLYKKRVAKFNLLQEKLKRAIELSFLLSGSKSVIDVPDFNPPADADPLVVIEKTVHALKRANRAAAREIVIGPLKEPIVCYRPSKDARNQIQRMDGQPIDIS